jgi:hypothetical protein
MNIFMLSHYVNALVEEVSVVAPLPVLPDCLYSFSTNTQQEASAPQGMNAGEVYPHDRSDRELMLTALPGYCSLLLVQSPVHHLARVLEVGEQASPVHSV